MMMMMMMMIFDMTILCFCSFIELSNQKLLKRSRRRNQAFDVVNDLELKVCYIRADPVQSALHRLQ